MLEMMLAYQYWHKGGVVFVAIGHDYHLSNHHHLPNYHPASCWYSSGSSTSTSPPELDPATADVSQRGYRWGNGLSGVSKKVHAVTFLRLYQRGRGLPSELHPPWPPLFVSTFTRAHFEHNNHGDGGGDGMERNSGRNHHKPAADTSVDLYDLMMWRNFSRRALNLISRFPTTKVTVIN